MTSSTQNPTPNPTTTRQYLAFRTLAADAPFRELLRDAHRSFRRFRQTHQSLTTPTRSRKP
jgi:hypothetical protein